MRLIIINNENKSVSVWDDRVCLAVYEMTNIPVSREDILDLLTADFKEKA